MSIHSHNGKTYDIAFAGAGLAGLSLAVRLAALPDPPRMALIDPRCNPPRDRTWCHWEIHGHPFSAAVSHRWQDWVVSEGNRVVTTSNSRYPYACIPSDRFFQIAYERLSGSQHVDFLSGISVDAIDNHSNGAVLNLSDGSTLCADWVFDSRPPQESYASWRQIFRGLELHSSEANLNLTAVTLMDFISADENGIRFFYVLPLDGSSFLVEDTWLVPVGRTPHLEDGYILDYARQKLAPVDWQISHREQGDLPMGLKSQDSSTQKNSSRTILWGTPAGAVRASSGYTFSRVQRASDRMTTAWQKTGRPDPTAFHELPYLSWMDRIFLRAMANHPHRVPEYFTRLFDRVPAQSLVRFLESEPRMADLWHVMRALPAVPLLTAAFR